MLPGVDVIHIGQWPKDVHSGNVVLAGILNHSEMKNIFKKCHLFLHPAIRDACPNVILEALAMGLPVIYNSYEGSSSELVADAGIALDENNLDKTILHAKVRFIKMRQLALKRRELFRLDIILQKYKEIFMIAEKKYKDR
jgi:glycosyltransferase involved in cell wall biosynthesis